MKDTSTSINTAISNRFYGAWLRHKAYWPYTNHQQPDRMSQMEVICTNFVMQVLQFSHRCTVAYTSWEREPSVGVNERHFTLDQSRKLECKSKTGSQSVAEGQVLLIVHWSQETQSKATSNGSAYILTALRSSSISYYISAAKENHLISCNIWTITYEERSSSTTLPAYYISLPTSYSDRASERAMKSVAQTQSSSIRNAEVLGYIYIYIYKRVEIFIGVEGVRLEASPVALHSIKIACLSSLHGNFRTVNSDVGLHSFPNDCSFPTLWNPLQMQIDCAPILQDRVTRNFNWW